MGSVYDWPHLVQGRREDGGKARKSWRSGRHIKPVQTHCESSSLHSSETLTALRPLPRLSREALFTQGVPMFGDLIDRAVRGTHAVFISTNGVVLVDIERRFRRETAQKMPLCRSTQYLHRNNSNAISCRAEIEVSTCIRYPQVCADGLVAFLFNFARIHGTVAMQT